MLIIDKLMNSEGGKCLDIFKTQLGPVAKNATLGHPAGNETRQTVAQSMAMCSVFIMAVMPIK